MTGRYMVLGLKNNFTKHIEFDIEMARTIYVP